MTTELYSTSVTGVTQFLGEYQMSPFEAIATFTECFRDYWRNLQNEGHSADTIWYK